MHQKLKLVSRLWGSEFLTFVSCTYQQGKHNACHFFRPFRAAAHVFRPQEWQKGAYLWRDGGSWPICRGRFQCPGLEHGLGRLVVSAGPWLANVATMPGAHSVLPCSKNLQADMSVEIPKEGTLRSIASFVKESVVQSTGPYVLQCCATGRRTPTHLFTQGVLRCDFLHSWGLGRW